MSNLSIYVENFVSYLQILFFEVICWFQKKSGKTKWLSFISSIWYCYIVVWATRAILLNMALLVNILWLLILVSVDWMVLKAVRVSVNLVQCDSDHRCCVGALYIFYKILWNSDKALEATLPRVSLCEWNCNSLNEKFCWWSSCCILISD